MTHPARRLLLSMIGRYAKALSYSKAVIFVIDPVGFLPTTKAHKFSDEQVLSRSPLSVAAEIRASLRSICETLELVHNASPRELDIPICMVIGKSDVIDWDFDYEGETFRAMDRVNSEIALRSSLLQSSDRVRSAFMAAGGALVADEIENV